jgi:hypothetical protein
MTDQNEKIELNDRLALIESMISEGRRTTESWGWTFLLWGVAYLVAIGWTALAHDSSAWFYTMNGAWILMVLIIWRKAKNRPAKQPPTTVGRAITSIWISMGISMTIVLTAIGFSGHYTSQQFVAIIGAMLGTANAASGTILKWKAQIGCALVWWITSAVSCFSTAEQSTLALVVAIFICQIVFGTYAMILEAKRRRLRGESHA